MPGPANDITTVTVYSPEVSLQIGWPPRVIVFSGLRSFVAAPVPPESAEWTTALNVSADEPSPFSLDGEPVTLEQLLFGGAVSPPRELMAEVDISASHYNAAVAVRLKTIPKPEPGTDHARE